MVREIESLEDLQPGYVLNLFGGPTGRIGNVIHPNNCPHVQQMTVPPRKLWAESVQELEAWITAQGGELDPTTPTCRYV